MIMVYILGYGFIALVVIYGLYELITSAVKKGVREGIKEYEKEKQIKEKKEAAKAAEAKKEREHGTEVK